MKQTKPRPLTIKQKLFTKEYVKTRNATKATINAGYNPKSNGVARAIGSENLTKPDIKREIDKLLLKHDITLENALLPIARSLRAKKLVAIEGDFFETELDDVELQLKGSDRALKLLGVTNNTTGTNLHLHLHKQAEELDI